MSVSHQPEDERLRQFLQWREETGRVPEPRLLTGKQLFYSGLVGIAVGTVLASVLVVSFLPDPRPRDEGRASTAATPQPPVAVTTEPSVPVRAEPPPSQPDDPRVAAFEPAPELPPRPGKRLATQPPVDRRPPRPSLPVSDLPDPPPALDLPRTPAAPAAIDPPPEPAASARRDQRSDATATVPPPPEN